MECFLNLKFSANKKIFGAEFNGTVEPCIYGEQFEPGDGPIVEKFCLGLIPPQGIGTQLREKPL